jgi:hypothetical protein
MSATAAPTERQLRYLRSLASRTATTFTTPASRRDASREIDRLRRLERAPQERAEQEDLAYATAVHEDELTGFGASRRWRSKAPAPAERPRIAGPAPSVIARYTLSSGERLIEAARADDRLRIRDLPAGGPGETYEIESIGLGEADRELPALLADYLRRARELDAVPMSGQALGQMLAGGCAGA